MTAYSRIQKHYPLYTMTVELQSVNRKHLDVQCVLSKEITFLENDIRAALSDVLRRGQVIAHVTVDYKDSPPCDVSVRVPLAKKLNMAVQQLSEKLNCPELLHPEALMALFYREGVIKVQPSLSIDAQMKRSVLETVDSALVQLDKMRIREGKYLQKEFTTRLQVMKKRTQAIVKQLPVIIHRYRERLLKIPPDDTISFEKQIGIYSEKVDIAEELSRFLYHIDHVLEILKGKESAGKLIEFVLQELLREINTMGSKVQESTITKNIVLIKNEIEKVREQIQNVE